MPLQLPLERKWLTCFQGFSSNTTNSVYKVEDEKKKLTIEEMNA